MSTYVPAIEDPIGTFMTHYQRIVPPVSLSRFNRWVSDALSTDITIQVRRTRRPIAMRTSTETQRG